MATKPELGIKDPYSLDATQFQAAVDLLKEQRKNITTYWSAVGAQVDAFTKGDMVVGTTWQAQVNTLTGAKVPIKSTLPKEGTTGWSDTWMISSKAKNPNCMYMWMDYIISPVPNAHGDGVLRRGAGEPAGLCRGREAERGALRHLPRDRRDVLGERLPLEHAVEGVHRWARAHLHRLLGVDQAWTEIKG